MSFCSVRRTVGWFAHGQPSVTPPSVGTVITCINWENVGSGAAPGGFFRDAEGIVHLTAKVFDNTSGGAGCTLPDAIFFLPPGYGPAGGTEEFDAAGCQGGTYAATNVDVQTDGEVQPPNNGCVSLDGVTFRAG